MSQELWEAVLLTRKQRDLLVFISERVNADGVSPSFDEMREALDLKSKSGIHRLIVALEERGYIRRLAHKARAIEILKTVDGTDTPRFDPQIIDGGKTELPAAALHIEKDSAIHIPLVGQIAAGVPIEALQQDNGDVPVPPSMMRSGKHYALEVRGDSMIDAGIHDGDIVVIQEQSTAQNGDIVVALIEDQEATLKRLRKNGNAIALEAANPAFETRVYRAEQVRIQGKLVGLMRTY